MRWYVFFSFLYVIDCGNYFQPGRFLVKIDSIDEVQAVRIAERHGFHIERKTESFDNVYIGRWMERRRKRDVSADLVYNLLKGQHMEWVEELSTFERSKRQSISMAKEPIHVWDLTPSMNLRKVWTPCAKSNITVAILDDGIDFSHPDLHDAFSAPISFDFVDFKKLPTPTDDESNVHGTQCAGLISMNGTKCGVGVFAGAKLAGIRVLGDGWLNDAIEGDAVGYRSHEIDIYSASWGPRDDGKTADAPQMLTSEALARGVTEGRKGKGNIYVWASGNGGAEGDNCAWDGYASNRFTLTFGLVDRTGVPAVYSEACSAILASVSGGDSLIKTTGQNESCSVISGSSASAAIAAGIIALVLEANPSLTQRDIQQLIVETSRTEEIHGVSWNQNAVGRKFSNQVGFGLLDADELIRRARTWKSVDEEKSFAVKVGEMQPTENGLIANFEVDVLLKLERITVTTKITSSDRGSIRITLTSPSGTTSEILTPRVKDRWQGEMEWTMVTVQFWGETSKGTWTIEAVGSVKMDGTQVNFLGV